MLYEVITKIQELKEKYKGDAQKMNMEMMELYRRHKVNPLAGCLPMLIQLPIWFALYRVLWVSIDLYQQPFLFYCDLTARDPSYNFV